MATATQGAFVSRTRNYVPDLNSYSTTHAVGPSSTYNATGSNFKPSAFFIQAGSNYTLTPLDGGATLTTGLIVGQIYPIALKKIVNTSGTTVVLLK